MLDFIRKMTLAGAGLAIMTTEKIQEMMDELVKKGQMTEKEAKDAVCKLGIVSRTYRNMNRYC
ncbi:MAG: hypothetical protein FJ139_06935 [Deltaproteobacteria bacterium]|nr:hypothetical protein [Deltaproteobacteria bacterium]